MPRPLDLRERIVIVDALLIERMNPKPDDPFIALKSDRDIANDILDKGGLVVSLHRHMSFVFSFQQRIQGCGCRRLRVFNQFFNPHEFGCGARAWTTPYFDSDVAPLVVCSVFANRLTARTEACNGYAHSENKVRCHAIHLAREGTFVIHQGSRVTGSVGAPEVIVAGPFARVRNPLYVGNVLMYIGIGIMSNALYPWLLLAALAWFSFQYFQIVTAEEEFLEKEFGAVYLEYKRNVPRFIPHLSVYVNAAQSKQLSNWKEAIHSERRTFQALSLVLLVLLVLWYAR